MFLFRSFSISRIFTICLLLFISLNTLGQQGVAINEVMSSNRTTIADEDGDFSDWIELYNYSDVPVDIKGWGLSDNPTNPLKWVFPATKLNPREYLLVWASGKNKTAPPLTQKTLISENSIWKYLDDGSDQGTAWKESGFDDSVWPQGPAMLGYDTNNNTQFGTQLSFGTNASFKHLTYYLRNDFEIIDASKFEELELKLSVDDGAIIYINGQEVVRRNMPEGNVSNTTPAAILVGILDVSQHLIPATMLVNGKNTIAVQLHQINRTSSDLRFDLELKSRGRFLHTNFSISNGNEEILLSHPQNGLADRLDAIELPADVSVGRWPNGTGEFGFYTVPTPGSPNNDQRFSEILAPPVFSHAAGFYSQPFTLAITSNNENATIIYTLDGSEPDPENLTGKTFTFKNSFPGSLLTSTFKSFLYFEPLRIMDKSPNPEYISTFASDYNGARYTSTTNRLFKGTVIKAKAVKSGALPSQSVTSTYFIHPQLHNKYSFPVLSITTPAADLFDYNTGIYTPGVIWETQANNRRDGGAPANYNQQGDEWERAAHLEFFDGAPINPVISQGIGIRTHGGWSRSWPMKSLRVYARNSFGSDYMNHAIFPGKPYLQYKTIILRNSGNDWGRTMFLDAAAQTVVSKMRFDTQAYRPIILFINGEYWGIHNIRDRYDNYYLNRVYGVDPENLDLLEINSSEPREGDWVHYNQLISYISANNLALDNHYKHVQTLMDVENFMDYQIAQIYLANTDWPGNNNNFWRLRTTQYKPYAPYGHDGRWRWLMFDTDFGFSGTNNATHNTLTFATEPNGPAWPNPPQSTLILRRLLLNTSFKNDFINRFADMLNTHFAPGRANQIINEMRDALNPEMQEHINRWGRPGSMTNWLTDVSRMNAFVNARPMQMRQFMQNYFNILGQVTLTVDVSNPSHGYVRVNTIELNGSTPGVAGQPFPWNGVYFYGTPIRFEAVSKPGFIFSHWDGLINRFTPIANQSFSTSSAAIRAHFRASDVVHAWHFNNLPNNALQSVTTNLSLPETGTITYPGSGDGYMDRVNPGTTFNTIDENPAGFGLRVRNPANTRELILKIPTTGYQNIVFSYATMRTLNGANIQEVYYQTIAGGPWIPLAEMLRVEEEWMVYRFNLPGNNVNNNPDLAIKILFRGEQAEGTSGNNRFDNIMVEGLNILTSGASQNSDLETEIKKEELNIWHRNGILRFNNPYQGNATLAVFISSGSTAGLFAVSGHGGQAIPFLSKPGIYVVRLVSNEGVSTGKFVVAE